jgi:glycosyltransferase involved in cell wall biosynthesis
MHIALLAPPYLPCPPKGYGGTEYVVAELADGLTRRGHEVTLFAHADSRTAAKLVPTIDEPQEIFFFHREVLHTRDVVGQVGAEFDVLHNHTVAALVFEKWLPVPMVTTVHGLTTTRGSGKIFREFRHSRYVAISDAQKRTGQPGLNWIDRVHNGIDTDFYRPADTGGEPYLIHVATLCERKGTATAVRTALAAGVRLLLVGPVYSSDQDYFDQAVRPFLDDDRIVYVGEKTGAEKRDLIAGARAMLLPIAWEEPFGLVMAEALACGVPVIVGDRGSARELVEHGRTGFVCRGDDDYVAAVGRLAEIDRAACRDAAVRSYSVAAMLDGYERVYEAVAE